ncbi:UDP-galactose/UDP-glucose transporter 3 [Tetrabaena socialis]|uniref:UDP-galactose/UDP-glucose transporter 3 n=1 Tax=Tetrabaena socialis TaxID=47790 RepID=A0A2J7ZTT3_9CHLO|nr:UDP-galactose/UDP-glucose transporter 3 [Tetrabaena socialis]|eukprot:PNH03674.1 UDP-galactose/UDP-glucose transporter 3 [Tetrabaena socialis]
MTSGGRTTLGTALLLLFAVAGIYCSYLTQGIVHEHLAIKRYGEQQERFRNLEALNGAQALTCFVWAWVILQAMVLSGRVATADLAQWHSYWRAGITNSVGPACGMVALKNITYSAQVLAKSCKMVPVMLMGVLLHGKRYTTLEYMCMGLIGLGVAAFAQKGSSRVVESPNATLGYTLCFINLAFDGYTNAAQDAINERHRKSSPIHMMCWMNFWTALYYSAYMFVLSGTGMHLVDFCARHPDALVDIVLFCICGAVGQLFIFFTIKTFGSLLNTLVCTTRKFFSILLSVMWNGNPLLGNQWLGVGMVFAGLLLHTLGKTKKHVKKKAE